MKNIIFLFVVLFFSCRTIHDQIVDVSTNKVIVGYGKNATYRINHTQKKTIPQSDIYNIEEKGLYLGFTYGNGKESESLVYGSFEPGSTYRLSSGIYYGDSISKVKRVYGEPIFYEIRFWKDDQARVDCKFNGLFYKNIAFLPDSTNVFIKAIILGDFFSKK